MKNFREKSILTLALCVAMVCGLAACGQEQHSAKNTANLAAGIGSISTEEKSDVYVPEYLSLDHQQNSNSNHVKLEGNDLYYSISTKDKEAEASVTTIYKQSLVDDNLAAIDILMQENCYLSNFTTDSMGNIYMVINAYSQGRDAEEDSLTDVILRKCNAKGETVFERNITELMNEEAEDAYVQSIVVDGEENIYVAVERTIFLLNKNGEEQGSVGIADGFINGMGMGKDGNVYFYYYDKTFHTGGTVLSKIDFQNCMIAGTYVNLPDLGGNGLVPGTDKDFLMNDGAKLYEYDLATQTYEEMLVWLDSDINGIYVETFRTLEDGTIMAIVRDWSNQEMKIVKLIKTDVSQVEDKKEIVVATLYDSQELQEAAAQFNRENNNYHVTIRAYIDSNNEKQGSYNDAITGLYSDIVSGINGPDIINLSMMDESKLAAIGVLEDLNPYLVNSSRFSREDFVEPVLEAFSHEEKLTSLSATFRIQTMAGKSSVVGEERGWSIEEMMACAKDYPDALLLGGTQKTSILSYCMLYSQESYIDWEKEKCYFDTDEFKQILEFANMFPELIDWSTYDSSENVEKLQANQILLTDVSIYELQDIRECEAMIGEPVTFIGFPTADGSVGCGLYTSSRYGITANSRNKEGAWLFIESYLANASDSTFSWGLPSLKKDFEKMMADAVTVTEDNTEEPVSDALRLSSEDVEFLKELIAEAKPMSNTDNKLLLILMEEAAAYFQGQKTLDEVAEIIQNRAQIYVSENS